MTLRDIQEYIENVQRANGFIYNWYVNEDPVHPVYRVHLWHIYMWRDANVRSISNLPHNERLLISDIYVYNGRIMKHPESLMVGLNINDLEFIFHTKCDCGSASVGSDRHSHYCSVAKDSTLAKSSTLNARLK